MEGVGHLYAGTFPLRVAYDIRCIRGKYKGDSSLARESFTKAFRISDVPARWCPSYYYLLCMTLLCG